MPSEVASRTPSLARIVDDLRTWADTIEGMEDGPEREQALAEMANAALAERTKVDRLAAFRQRTEAEASRLRARAKADSARAATLERLIDGLDKYAISVMRDNNRESLYGEEWSLRVRQCPEHVVIDGDVPAEYKTVKQEIAIDKRAIATALKAGDEVPGARLERNLKLEIL